MKVTCKQQDLNRGRPRRGHAVSSRSTLPILSNVLLATDAGRLRLYATNLEIGITCWIDAQVSEEGSTTVPARRITDFVSSLPPSPVDISVPLDTPLRPAERQLDATAALPVGTRRSHRVSVKSLRSSATIEGMDSSEFPLSPSAEGSEEPVGIDAAQLKEVIEQVAFAAADDDPRPVFTGVLVQVNHEKMTFAAADAFRLAVRVAPLSPGDSTTRLSSDMLIPARTLTELGRILPPEGSVFRPPTNSRSTSGQAVGKEETVQMIVTPNRSQVLFHTEHIDLLSCLIEGTFPNFHQIIPKEYTTRAVISTSEFAAAVKSVAPFARDSSNITRIKISSAGDLEPGTLSSITIEATAQDVGSGVSTINASVAGPEQQIIFNVKYLADVLSVIDTPEVALEVTSAARPGVVKPVVLSDSLGEARRGSGVGSRNTEVGSADYTYVIMPMSEKR